MARRSVAEVMSGAAVLLVAAGFLAYAVAHSGRSVTSGYNLTAKFDHIDGLAVGADAGSIFAASATVAAPTGSPSAAPLAPVPEPGTLALVAAAVCAAAVGQGVRWRRKKS